MRVEGKDIVVCSFDGLVEYTELAPSFHAAEWASWWGFRLLHPDRLIHFDTELRKLFEDYKKGQRKWATYNEEKRVILARYLNEPYDPPKRRKKQ